MLPTLLPIVLALVPVQAAAPFDWMTGAWCTGDPSARTCERWSPMEAGTMLGTGHSVRSGRTESFEFMRIAMEGDVAIFYGAPGGAPAVAFRQVKAGPSSVVFENAAHDYPQRIRYWREGESLKAEISKIDGSNAMGWSFIRVAR